MGLILQQLVPEPQANLYWWLLLHLSNNNLTNDISLTNSRIPFNKPKYLHKSLIDF